jgi:large subunit ribosomal protein L5
MSIPALKKHYQDVVVPALQKSGKYANVHEIPQITKVVINSGFDASLDKNQIAETQKEISTIAGQHAVITKARLSISNFKLREGMPVGVMTTLRGPRMYEFLYRMIGIALPGIRDFRGVHDKFDGNGNYALGITDHSIFPEVSHDGSKRQLGMDICIVTSAKTDDEGRELLKLMGMPFRKRQSSASAA